MRKQAQPQGRRDSSFQSINTSVTPLDYNKRQNFMGSLQTMGDDENFGKPFNYTSLTKDSMEENNKEMYRPASYAKALEYKNNRSYIKKTEDQFKELDLFVDTEELKYFGLGFYFYVEWYRRLFWLMLAMTIIQGVTIVINYMGDGMSSYESSFSTYLIKTTVANYSGNTGTTLTPYDTLLVAGLPALNFLALLIFALVWKVHRRRAVNKQEEDNNDVKPQKFSIEFQGFQEDQNNEEQLKRFFSNFGPVYEASLIRNHENTLSDFQKLDEIEEEIKEEQLQIVLGSGSQSTVQKLKGQKQQMQQKMMGLNVHPTTQSAFVHFQFEKSKKECLEEFKQHYQYAKCSHACCRTICCCCVPDSTDRITFRGNKLLVKSEKVPAPEDINWDHFQITPCGKFLRGCGAFFVIILFLLISCCIIGICSIYISSHSSNCDGLNISSYTAATATASASTTIMQCYCNANLIESFTDSTIKTACKDYLTGIYIEQSIQYVVIITSIVTNFLFGLVVNKLIDCVRPASQGSALYAKTAIYTLFIFLNSICVPILIYGDIFGLTVSNYVSFITIVSSDFKNFLQVSNISFYPNFTSVWYRNVSPIFTNSLILDVILIWVFFLLDKCCFANKSNLENKEGKMLQKRMNREITQYSLDVYKESSDLFLVVITVVLFSTGVPVLLPLGLINIFSRYVTTRSLLQNNSTRVDGLGQDFSSLTSTILTLCLIISPLFGEWMLIANTKIASDVVLLTGSLASSYSFGIYQLQMELYLPIYIGISVLAIGEYLLFTFASTLCGCLCSCCQAPPPNYHTRPFWEYAKGMNVLCSYNIRKNDKMRNAVLYLQKYLGEKTKI